MVRQAVSDYHISMLSLQELLAKLFPEQASFKISVCPGEEKAVRFVCLWLWSERYRTILSLSRSHDWSPR